MKPRLVVAYLRVSTREQTLGPEAQRATIEAWAARSNVVVLSWHTDNVSGRRPWQKRPGLCAALAAGAAGKAKGLVVARRDRIGRQVQVTLEIEVELARRKMRLLSAAGEGTEGPAGTSTARLVSGVADLLAEVEGLAIRERTRAALGVLKAQGKRYGQVPLGYKDDGTGRLVEEPSETAVIELIRAQRGRGRSLRAIVLDLKRRGCLGRTGRPYSLGTVARVALAFSTPSPSVGEVDG